MNSKKYSGSAILTIFILLVLVLTIGFFLRIKYYYPKEKIYSIILPHADIGAKMRQETFNEIKKYKTSNTLIILTPDHYQASNHAITLSDKNWQTSQAKIEANKHLIQKLNYPIQNDLFLNEHGIKNLLIDIKKFNNDAIIVPIMISPRATKKNIDQLFQKLYDTCNGCTIVSSVDFSHYAPMSIADTHDIFSKSALQNLDQDKVLQSETDCPLALYLAIKWAKLHQNKSFRIVDQKNSEQIYSFDQETTSILAGYFSSRSNPVDPSSTFIIGGNFSSAMIQKFPPRIFQGVDLSMVNLDNPKNKSLAQKMYINTLICKSTNCLTEQKLNSKIKIIFNRIIAPIPIIIFQIDDTNISNLISIKNNIQDNTFAVVYLNDSTLSPDKFVQISQYIINLGADLILSDNEMLEPSISFYKTKPIVSSLTNIKSNDLQIDMILAGRLRQNQLTLSFHPVSKNNNELLFLKNNEKKQAITEFAPSLPFVFTGHNNDTIDINN